MVYIFNTLAPIIILVALGVILRKQKFTSPHFFKETNKLVFYVGLPALLFFKASAVHFIEDRAVKLFLALGITSILIILLGYILSLILRVPKKSMGALVQGGYRGNQAFVGLPVVFFALDGLGVDNSIQGMVVMSIIPIMVLYNFLAVPVLLIGLGNSEVSATQRLKLSLKKLITNPIILSGLLGLVYGLLNLPLPKVIERTIVVISGISMPFALMGVGASLMVGRIKSVAIYASIASFVKIIINPLVCYYVCMYLGLNDIERLIALLFSASPAAAMCYVMTDQLGGDTDLAAGGIVLSTLFSPLPMAVILAFA